MNPSVLYSGDEGGRVAILEVDSGSVRTFFFGREPIYALRASPHAEGILAMGCKRGLVMIADAKGERMKKKCLTAC